MVLRTLLNPKGQKKRWREESFVNTSWKGRGEEKDL